MGVKTGKGTGKSQHIINRNIERGKEAGKPGEQATAVALSKARKASKRKKAED